PLADVSTADPMQEVPLGTAVRGVNLYLLDESLEDVPSGEVGELYFGGVQVARGYLNRPELTAERFTIHPRNPDERLYKSGDLARFRADGELEFLGRSDDQVKIRGFRIELGEIESALEALTAGVVVLAKEDEAGDLRLVAYVVGERAPEDLQNYLKDHLPAYMLPSVYVPLASLPITAGGKVDKKALPEPDWSQRIVSTEYVAPRSDLEKQLAGIWSTVLGVKTIGISDNFFELGGHSLSAARLIALIEKELDSQLPLSALFAHPTIEATIAVLDSIPQQENQTRLEPVSRADVMPVSYTQQRMWFLSRLENSSVAYNITLGYRLRGSVDASALQASLEYIMQRHEILRTGIITEDGIPVQVIHANAVLDFEKIEVADEVEVHNAIGELAHHVFDLTAPPLIRFRLFHLSAGEHVLVMVAHHIIFDGWSEGVLLEEIRTCYMAFVQGETPELEPLPVQYADYAAWQQSDQARFATDLAYWREQLSGELPRLQLPTDRGQPLQPGYAGKTIHYKPDLSLIKQLHTRSQQAQVTPFVMILAAFNALMYRYTGQEDIVLGSAVAGRQQETVQRMIGAFINTITLRSFVDGEMHFDELLHREREIVLGAYDHSQIPFERVLEAAQSSRDGRGTPLFQVLFNLVNVPRELMPVAGLTWEHMDIDPGTTPLDLYIEIEDRNPQLVFIIRFNTEIFDESTVQRLFQHYDTLLRGVVANPGAKVAELPLLTSQEQEQLLKRWNQTQAEYPKVCLHEWFEDQVERTPDAIAAMAGGEAISYGDLNARANQLAHYLRKFGVEPDMLVAVHIDRSLDMLVAVLGVMKAGGAYVPLDPDFPKDRLEIIV
ncbi:MAG TPA: condensation domain-containing protein, partial [Aggregatilineales bacterium]|nr:condensation domain-containing protein [Aggregatilineales bacterium]